MSALKGGLKHNSCELGHGTHEVCGSNHAWARMNCVQDQRAQTRNGAAVVSDQPSCLNHNMAAHGRYQSWKAGEMAVVVVVGGGSNVKNNMHGNKEDSIVHGCVLHLCRDALNCSDRKQVARLASISCVLVVLQTNSLHMATDHVGLCTYATMPMHGITLLM